jgi:hypothetical protein
MAEEDVAATARRPALNRRRQGAVLSFERAQLLLAAVDVDDDDSGHRAGRHGDVQVGARPPPRLDLLRVLARVLEAVRGRGLLAARPAREDGQAFRGELERVAQC